jgi:FAD/FMN-containing dehydrogenase
MEGAGAGTLSGALPLREELVQGWGMSCGGRAPVARPRRADELHAALELARSRGLSVGLRGAGCSYGDAAINSDGMVLDLRALKRVLAFDRAAGVIHCEPGVTIEQIWRLALPAGWWPPVVPGTMFPTLGGCAAMNIHGKNNFQAGTIGEHITRFGLMLADGSVRECDREREPELFHAAIGGFGMLGCFTDLTLKLKRVHSGDLRVRPVATASIPEMIAFFESEHARTDYLVGWVDAFGGGRGLIHQAWYLHEGEDPDPAATLLAAHQDLPSRFFLVVPKSWLWFGLWCFLNQAGMRVVNAMKYRSGVRHARTPPYRQPLVAFSFLLDYVPNWKHAYRPGGLIQYQTFVPKADAARVFQEQIRLAREAGLLPYLGVLKKHRPDPFLMTHAVDGYSLALDFPVGGGNRRRVWELARRMDPVVAGAGGRFYFAKDSTMTPEVLRRVYPRERVEAFLDLKRRLDPGSLFQTDLSRRLLSPHL